MNKKLLLILAAELTGLTLYYLHVCYTSAGGFGFPLDDAWIHAHLARNIAEGSGIVYNPGQHVTTTAMLYTVLLAALYKVHMAPIFDAALLGLLVHFAAGYTVYLIARRVLDREIWAAACAIIFLAIPRLMWGALSGMEVPLYVFLVTLGIYWHMNYQWNEGPKAYLGTLAFSLCALARPECSAFMGLALLDRLVSIKAAGSEKGTLSRFLKTVPLHFVLFFVVVLPLLAFNYTSYGLALPPAFYAKTHSLQHAGGLASIVMRLKTSVSYLSQMIISCRRDSLILAIALIPGLIAVWRLYRKSPRSGIMILPMGMIALPALTGVIASIGVGKNQLLFQTGRYSGYLSPILIIIGVMGIVEACKWFGKLSVPAARISGAVTVSLLIGTLWILSLSNILMAYYFSGEVQNINAMQVELGRWAEHLPKGSVIAVNDAGAIPFFSHKRIIDTVGVVNPQVVPYLRRNKDRQVGLLQYLSEQKPDYVIIFPNWYSKLAARRDILHPIKSIRLRRDKDVGVCGGPEMVVYKPDWKAAKLRPEL